MSIFAVFRRKTKAAVEEPAEETGTAVPTTDTTAEDGNAGAAAIEPDEGAAGSADCVEIPRQQSAAAAADNEAGEVARK